MVERSLQPKEWWKNELNHSGNNCIILYTDCNKNQDSFGKAEGIEKGYRGKK